MNAKELFALAPYGALVSFSDGTPRPPERFTKKLSAWKHDNGAGYFVKARGGKGAGAWDVDEFKLQSQNGRVLTVNQSFSVPGCTKSFGVTPPEPGTILAYGDFDGVEVRHVWRDADAAHEWARTARYELGNCGQKYFIVAKDGELKTWEAIATPRASG